MVPLMLYHQIQLMVCAALAQRMGRRHDDDEASRPGRPGGGGAVNVV